MSETWEEKAVRLGRELVELGKEAYDRGDAHEFRHILASLQVGDTTRCDETCPLHYGHPELTIEPHGTMEP